MAQVPYSPVPSTQPTLQGPSPERINTPPAAFGTTIAGATEGLGQSMSQVGNELFNRALAMQQLTNETDAKNADAQYTKISSDLYSKLEAQQGINAVNAYPQYQKDLEDQRQQIRATLNPMAARMFDSSSLSSLGRANFNGARWAGAQHKAYIDGTSKSAVEMAQVDFGNSFNDPVASKTALDRINSETDLQAGVHGWSPVETEAHRQDAVAQAYYKRFEAQAVTQPFQARSEFEKDPSVVGKYRAQTEAMLERQEATVGSRQIVHNMTQGSYLDKTIAQESGGDFFATSKTTSAKGIAGFTDNTWTSLRYAHPDLALPAKVTDATGQQQLDALKALTADNQKALAKAGFDTNDQNTYLAHFLGAYGAVKFLRGMQADPGQSAVTLAGQDAADANRNIFYNPDGSERSAGEAFVRLTARFAGPGPLTKDSSPAWLSGALPVATQVARTLAPNNPMLEDQVQSRLRTQFDLVHNTYLHEQQVGFNQLMMTVQGNGNSDRAIRDMDTIYNNPQMAAMFNGMDPSFQKQIMRTVETQAKQDLPFTEPRRAMYTQMVGMFSNPEMRTQALNVDISSLDLPQAQKVALTRMRASIVSDVTKTDNLNRVLADPSVKAYVKGANLRVDSDEYNQFLGGLSERLQEYVNTNKKEPDSEWKRNTARELLQESGGFLGFGSSFGFQPPSGFVDEITSIFRTNKGRVPDSRELGMMYQYSLTHPNWRQELGK